MTAGGELVLYSVDSMVSTEVVQPVDSGTGVLSRRSACVEILMLRDARNGKLLLFSHA